MNALPHIKHIRNVLAHYVKNVADLDDVMQDVICKLWLDQTTPRYPLAYALMVARHAAIDWLLHHKVRLQMESIEELEERAEDVDTPDLVIADELAGVEELCEAQQQLAQLSQVVGAMPERQRQAFVLRKVYGYSPQEITSIMGITINTFDQHLQKAAIHLADGMGSYINVTGGRMRSVWKHQRAYRLGRRKA